MRPKKTHLTPLLALALSLQSLTPLEARDDPDQLNPTQIRAINVEVKNVFDPDVPGEDHWPYTWANALHIRTRAAIIRRQLLMKPGDVVDRALMEESERNLRALPFIKDAKIVEVPVSKTQSDLLVKTQDTWTTQPQIDFGSEGGQSHFAAGVEEDNLFGYGKTASYFVKRNQDGVTEQLGYIDPQISNTRLTLNTSFADTPFGDQENVSLSRPFYSLETRYAAGTSVNHVSTLQKIMSNGAELTEYGSDNTAVDGFVGYKLNDSVTDIYRLTVHYTYSQNAYDAKPLTAAGTLPNNLAQSGPLATWSLDQNHFIKETFIDKAERIEDINLGHDSSITLGYSDRVLGATDNTVPFTLLDSFGFGGNGPWFGLVSYGMNGRYNVYAANQTGGRPTNTLYFTTFNYYQHLLEDYPLTEAIHLESAYLQDSDTTHPLELGGDTGLRGFEVASFTGNKSMLANVETRFFYPYEVLHLAYLGGAAFLDAGEVQPQGQPFLRQDVHADVGVGLRIGLTRSTVGTIFRLDIAYALGPIPQTNRIIISLSSGQGFQRSGNSFRKVAPFLSSD